MKVEIQNLSRQIDEKRSELAQIFQKHKTADGYDMPESVVSEVNRRNDELTTMTGQLDEKRAALKTLEEIESRNADAVRTSSTVANGFVHTSRTGGTPGGGNEPQTETRNSQPVDLGKLFIASDAYQTRSMGRESRLSTLPGVEVRTLLQTTDGIAPEVTRSRPLLLSAQRSLRVLDLVPVNTTDQIAVKYLEETVFTNNAAETAEGGDYAEVELATEDKVENVKKVTVYLPVTDEQLNDVKYAEGYVRNRLPLMLRQRIDSQFINGNGVGNNLMGVLNMAGILTQAKSTDDLIIALRKAQTKIRVTAFAEPDAFVLHPDEWDTIRLMRTTDGIFIWGHPSEAGPERIFGTNVVATPVITSGSRVVGDWGTYTEAAYKDGVDVQVGYINDDFKKGKKGIRADVRLAFVKFRPAAFCKVTGA